jgi:hypothetical protein
LGVGEFFSPSNVFVERFEPQWINKLPDRPLAVYHGILPNISVGAQVRGGFPIGPTRVDYAFYVSNGPVLNTFDARTAGTLDFNSYTDNNDNKAVGGRVGFYPFRESKSVMALKPRSRAFKERLFLTFKR